MPSANVVQTSVSGGQQNALALQGDGVFLPKLSTATRTALTLGTSDKGFLAYDTTDNNVYIWNGAAWESIPASGDSSNTQVIFNDNGILAGDAGLTYDKATDSLTVLGNLGVGVSPSYNIHARGSTSGRIQVEGANGFGMVFVQASSGNAAQLQLNSNGGAGRRFAVFSDPSGFLGISDETAVATRLTIDSSGNASLTTGNLAVSNGKGIDFSATPQPAGATSELLNDYEEGTFTPAITGSTIAGTANYIGQYGKYTKIGNLVTVSLFLNWSAHTGTGDMRVTGLPYQNQNTFSAGSIGYANQIAVTAGNILSVYVEASQSFMTLSQFPTGGGVATTVPMDADGAIVISATYRI